MKQSIKVDFDYNFLLVGIVSSLKDYRLSSFINKAFDIQLLRGDDIENRYDDDHDSGSYARYTSIDEELEIYFDLVVNKNENGPLIKEKKEVDFFFLIDGPEQKVDIYQIVSKLNKIDNVQLAFEIDIQLLKSKQNLILE